MTVRWPTGNWLPIKTYLNQIPDPFQNIHFDRPIWVKQEDGTIWVAGYNKWSQSFTGLYPNRYPTDEDVQVVLRRQPLKNIWWWQPMSDQDIEEDYQD